MSNSKEYCAGEGMTSEGTQAVVCTPIFPFLNRNRIAQIPDSPTRSESQGSPFGPRHEHTLGLQYVTLSLCTERATGQLPLIPAARSPFRVPSPGFFCSHLKMRASHLRDAVDPTSQINGPKLGQQITRSFAAGMG